MNSPATVPEPAPPAPSLPLYKRILRYPATYLLGSAVLLALDVVTGPFLQFPILFVFPVALAAWYVGPRTAYGLALVLPVGRFVIAWLIDQPSPVAYMVVNALVRIAVLGLIAYLVRRIVSHAHQLEGRINSLVTICAWSRTVEYEGEWLSFEEYLRRRFEVKVTHGISPDQATRLRVSPDALRSGVARPCAPGCEDQAQRASPPVG